MDQTLGMAEKNFWGRRLMFSYRRPVEEIEYDQTQVIRSLYTRFRTRPIKLFENLENFIDALVEKGLFVEADGEKIPTWLKAAQDDQIEIQKVKWEIQSLEDERTLSEMQQEPEYEPDETHKENENAQFDKQ